MTDGRSPLPADGPAPAGAGRAVLVYSLHRLWLFATCVLLLSVVGLRGFALAVAALLASAVASTLLLRRQREAVAVAVAASRGRSQDRAASDRERVERATSPTEPPATA